jgi:hypothetical protein
MRMAEGLGTPRNISVGEANVKAAEISRLPALKTWSRPAQAR